MKQMVPVPKKSDSKLRLDFGVGGKHLFRIRERHVAEHLVPLIAGKAAATAKLDIVLRCIALSPQHTGKRQPGMVLPQCSWELLHDLSRGDKGLGAVEPGMDPSPEALRSKRKWVGRELGRLEEMNLVVRSQRAGRRPLLFALRDDGSGQPFDDPDGTPGNTYLTVLGGVIASGALGRWGAPQVAAYLAAMAAEKSETDRGRRVNPGSGRWYRPLAWFGDKERLYGPSDRVRINFSVATLERGIALLEKEKLITRRRILKNPRTNRRLKGPRNLYFNHFDTLESQVDLTEVDPIDELLEGFLKL